MKKIKPVRAWAWAWLWDGGTLLDTSTIREARWMVEDAEYGNVDRGRIVRVEIRVVEKAKRKGKK